MFVISLAPARGTISDRRHKFDNVFLCVSLRKNTVVHTAQHVALCVCIGLHPVGRGLYVLKFSHALRVHEWQWLCAFGALS